MSPEEYHQLISPDLALLFKAMYSTIDGDIVTIIGPVPYALEKEYLITQLNSLAKKHNATVLKIIEEV